MSTIPTESGPRAGSSRMMDRLAGVELLALVFLSSACILILELSAGRLVSQYLGQSLYTWTAIIGVVLAGMSAGNYTGGRLADRAAHSRTLAALFLAGALGCAATLPLNAFAGQWGALIGLPWPARIVGHVGLVFLVPAAFLGAISPVIAKRALDRTAGPGRALGSVYAWATAGSLAGALISGFWLPWWLGVRATLGMTAALLLAGAAWNFPRALAQPPSHAAQPAPHSVKADTQSARRTLGALLLPALLMVLCGAVLMGAEITVGRLLSRFYGQSLYTWTSVIGFVLAGMAAGSYAGGRLADRFPPRRVLPVLFIAAGLGLLAVPAITLAWTNANLFARLLIPGRVMVHAALALVLPAAMFGAAAPVLVKDALDRSGTRGRTVGMLYAANAAGNIAGTFLTGFYWIPAWGMLRVLVGLAALSAVLAVCSNRRSLIAYAGALTAGVALVCASAPWPAAEFWGQRLGWREGTDPRVVYTAESNYSYIAVAADPAQPSIRRMHLDRLIHSVIDLNNPLDIQYAYEWVYEGVVDHIKPPPAPVKALAIGGGGYAFPRYLELTRPDSLIQVAEIDPAVTEAAHATLGLPRDTAIRIFHMDARNHVEDLVRRARAGESIPAFDFIIGDSINDRSVPYHLTTLELHRMLASLLADDGVCLLNLVDRFDPGLFVGAVVHTWRQVFPSVCVFSCLGEGAGQDTFVVVGAKRPLALETVPDAIRARHPGFVGRLLTPPVVDALVKRAGYVTLTDDFAPVDNLLSAVFRPMEDVSLSLLAAADAALQEGNLDLAIQHCNAVVDRGVRLGDALEILGIALGRRGNLAGAVDALRRSVEAEPRRPSAWNNLGHALFGQGDVTGAIDAWRETLRQDPAFDDGHRQLASAYSQLKDYENAWQHVRALETAGKTVDAAFLEELKRNSGRAE